ncbi:MAG TPA: hypothetical protein VK588_16025, partial [Chitinophagaceae bacterium]|nr:hypothetical protein [Chitinophagaceae bacterium]
QGWKVTCVSYFSIAKRVYVRSRTPGNLGNEAAVAVSTSTAGCCECDINNSLDIECSFRAAAIYRKHTGNPIRVIF